MILNESGPVFTRSLRGCGLATAIYQIQDQLGIDELECAQLLTTCGRQSAGRVTARLAERIGHCLTEPIDQLFKQLQRTMTFLDQRGLNLTRFWMFGCGGSIAGMDHALTSQLGIKGRQWQLDQEHVSKSLSAIPAHAVFGAAIGFSLLRMEH